MSPFDIKLLQSRLGGGLRSQMVFDLAAPGTLAPRIYVAKLLSRRAVDTCIALLCHVSYDSFSLLGDVTDLARLLPAEQEAMPSHIADCVVVGRNQCLANIVAQPLIELGG